MVRIMVVDQHVLIRKGIISILNAEKDFDVIGEAATGEAAVMLAIDLKPDIIIMDLLLPDIDSIFAAQEIKAKRIRSKIIFLTDSKYNNAWLRRSAQRAGALGVLRKSEVIDNLICVIRTISGGVRSKSVLPMTAAYPISFPSKSFQLSSRETEIIELIAEGMNSREIARRLLISHKTVDAHRSNIMKKLDVTNMAAIVNFAFRTGIVD